MVPEQNKDDLLEVIYRMGGRQINKVVLLGVAKFQFDHWDNDTFWDTAKALEDDKLIVLRSPTGHAALTLDGRRRVEDRLYPGPTVTQNIVTTEPLAK